MTDRVYHVLFLSRRNSARSLFAEAVLRKLGRGAFAAHSAGVDPADAVEPLTLEMLERAGYPTEGLRPRHFSAFAGPDAQKLDFVFTLSDTAAGEDLPDWPGLPVTAHWSSTDPVLVEGEAWEKRQAYGRALAEMERRLRIFVSLPLSSLDRLSLKRKVDEIGEAETLEDA